MLTCTLRSSSGTQFCDGVSRRDFVRLGALPLGGLTLANLLRSRAEAGEPGRSQSKTSVIFLELAGGPTHIETYDPKPEAPLEFRGPLGVAASKLPGVYLSELMTRQAAIMDKLAVVRSITHTSSSHGTSSHLTQTGYYLRDPQQRENDMPCVGSITAKVRGANASGIPAFVSIPSLMRFGRPAYLGKQFGAFETVNDPSDKNFRVRNLALELGLSGARLEDRRQLLGQFDGGRQLLDTQGVADSVDSFSREAFELVTGNAARQAFDLSQESESTRDAYGRNTYGQGCLLARRLIEAGVTFVSVRITGWDDHSQIREAMLRKGPNYDQAVAALVTDLHERGRDQDVLVVAMGEFGRTPRVNASAGRDHWGTLMSVLLAGGGLRTGQVVGKTSVKGEVPQDAPYRPENVLAMIYRHLGIATDQLFNDFSGRPRFILEKRGLINELI